MSSVTAAVIVAALLAGRCSGTAHNRTVLQRKQQQQPHPETQLHYTDQGYIILSRYNQRQS